MQESQTGSQLSRKVAVIFFDMSAPRSPTIPIGLDSGSARELPYVNSFNQFYNESIDTIIFNFLLTPCHVAHFYLFKVMRCVQPLKCD